MVINAGHAPAAIMPRHFAIASRLIARVSSFSCNSHQLLTLIAPRFIQHYIDFLSPFLSFRITRTTCRTEYCHFQSCMFYSKLYIDGLGFRHAIEEDPR